MLFQGMFFIITPALICGAFAERMKFSTMVVFTILWGTLVYCPLAIGCGAAASCVRLPMVQRLCGVERWISAGGTVVHISSGVSALVCALLIGRRLGYGSEPMPPHNLTYTVVGAALLWVGWFGFNAGSQLQSDGVASSAFAATLFRAPRACWPGRPWNGSCAASRACWGLARGPWPAWCASRRPRGYVNPMPAMVMGAAAGVVCFLACTTLKAKFRYDDSLDAFGVHGVGGTLGAILTGVFATRAVTDVAHGKPLGMLEGGPLLKGQIVAAGGNLGLLAAVATFIILKVLDATMGLRVSQQEEIQGLDVSQHGEEGYIFV